MNDLNSVFLVGRLTKQPEVDVSEKGSVLSFTLANHYNTFNEEKKEYVEETGFYPVQLFGKQAEKLGSYLKKGQRIGVNGRLAKFGEDIGIIAYTIQMLDAPKPIEAMETPEKGKRSRKTA